MRISLDLFRKKRIRIAVGSFNVNIKMIENIMVPGLWPSGGLVDGCQHYDERAASIVWVLFRPEDGGIRFHRNVCTHVPH